LRSGSGWWNQLLSSFSSSFHLLFRNRF
jgi:hypothetical protein